MVENNQVMGSAVGKESAQRFGRWVIASLERQNMKQAALLKAFHSFGYEIKQSTLSGYLSGTSLTIPFQFPLALRWTGVLRDEDGREMPLDNICEILAGLAPPPSAAHPNKWENGLEIVRQLMADRRTTEFAWLTRLDQREMNRILLGGRPTETQINKLSSVCTTLEQVDTLRAAYGYSVTEKNAEPRRTTALDAGDTTAALRENQGNVAGTGGTAVMTKRKSETAAQVLQRKVKDRIEWASDTSGIPAERLQELLEGYEPTRGEGYELGLLFETKDEALEYFRAFDRA
ncbi:MAG: hypothetical protein AAFY26_21080 [Cyanobacteria bacterium J06638_22]